MKKSIIIIIGVVFVFLSSILSYAHANQHKNREGVHEDIKISLGGTQQWLFIRGENKNNPVLLMLSGGPGGSEAGRFLKYNKELQKDFIVVIWEQRGCGKSYYAIKDRKKMNVDQYVSDINELSIYLRKKFNKPKIYLLGHSWGTIIGIKAVQKYPENFYAYVGTAQMVSIPETDIFMYEYVLRQSKKHGITKLQKELEKQGPPPYYDKNMLKKYVNFLTNYGYFYSVENNFYENNSEWNTWQSLFCLKEYNFIDSINSMKGLIFTFQLVYPQLQNLDFKKQATTLKVPVYFLIGKHDYTAKFIQDYYNVLSSPKKKLIWFENSAHGEIWSEADKFHSIMKNTVLK